MHQIIIIIAKYFVILPVLAALYIFLKLDRKQQMRYAAYFLVSAIITTLLVKIATTIHQDPRPFVRDGVVPYFKSSTDNGFPSDHTTFSALFGFVALQYSRRLGIGLLVLSLLIGAARVIAGVHHAQDIIGGFLIAGGAVLICWLIFRFIDKFRSKKSV